MSSYKELTNSPAYNFLGENAWDIKIPSYHWIEYDGSLLLQNSYPDLFNKIGFIIDIPGGSFSFSNTIETSIQINDVINVENQFVYVGSNGTLAISTDGINWDQQDSSTPNNINDIIYANNTYVYVGDNGTISTSPDAISWIQTESLSNTQGTITYVGGKTFNRAGSTSTTNLSLTDLTGGTSSAPAAGDIVFIAVATGSSTLRSQAVSGYTQIASLRGDDNIDTNLWVGYKLMTSTPDTTVTIPSTGSVDDAQTVAIQVWRNVHPDIFDVTSTSNTLNNTVLVDPPAITTQTRNAVLLVIGAGAHANGTQTYAASYLDNFLTIGADDLYDSTIGFGSIVQTIPGTYNPAAFTFSGTSAATNSTASVTIALKQPKLFTSENINTITYGNNNFVITGENNLLATSSNLFSLTEIVSPTTNNISDIIYANNNFIAVDNEGNLLTSSNGNSWVLSSLDKDSIFSQDSLIFVGRTAYARPDGLSGLVSINLSLLGGTDLLPQEDDVVFIAVATGSAAQRSQAVFGYTEIANLYANDTIDTNLWVGYKRMGPTPDTTVNIPDPGSTLDGQVVIIQVWRNVHRDIFDVMPTTVTTANTVLVDPPAITTNISNTVLLVVGAGGHSEGASRQYLASYLSNFISLGSSNKDYDSTIGFGSIAQPTAGTYDPAAWLFNDTDTTDFSYASVTIAIKPTYGILKKIRNILYANNIFVASGTNGTLITSPDAVTWTERSSGTSSNILSLTYSEAEKYYTYGTESFSIGRSKDTISWNNYKLSLLFPPTYVGGKTLARAGSTTTQSLSLTNLTGGTSSAPAAGDIVFIAVATGSTTLRSQAVSGYTQIASLYSNNTAAIGPRDTNLWVGYKVMGSTPDTEVTIPSTGSASDAQTVAIQVWKNVHPDIFDVTSTTSTSTTSVLANPSAITTLTDNSVLLVIGAGGHSAGTLIAGTQTYTASYLSNFLTIGSNDDNDSTIGFGSIARPTAGTYDPAAFTFSGSDLSAYSSAAVTIAIKQNNQILSLTPKKLDYILITNYNDPNILTFYNYDTDVEFKVPTVTDLPIINGLNNNVYIKG
jgi:hypothetical protein